MTNIKIIMKRMKKADIKTTYNESVIDRENRWGWRYGV